MSASISRIGSAAAAHAHHASGKATAAGSFESLFAALAGSAQSPAATLPSAEATPVGVGDDTQAQHDETKRETGLPESMPAVAILVSMPALGTPSDDAAMGGGIDRGDRGGSAMPGKSETARPLGASPSSVPGSAADRTAAGVRASTLSAQSLIDDESRAVAAAAASRAAPKPSDAPFPTGAAAPTPSAAPAARRFSASQPLLNASEIPVRLEADVAGQQPLQPMAQPAASLRATAPRTTNRELVPDAGDVGAVDASAGVSASTSSQPAASLSTVLALGRADALVPKHASAGTDSSAQPLTAPVMTEGRVDAGPQAATTLPGSSSFDAAAWTAALARHVQMLAQGEHAETSINLEPQGLGPMQVSVRIQDAQVHVHFSILHPVTQALVRDALPALQRMLGDGGMSLGQASVSQQQAGGGERQPGAAPKLRESAAGVEARVDHLAVPQAQRVRVGLLDDFI